MASHHPSDPDSAPNSVASTPRSDHPPPPPVQWHPEDAAAPRVRLMCSFRGRILPRPHDNQLRYVGGDTRIVAVHRSTTFSDLHFQLAKLAGTPDVAVKYQLPNEDLDSLISVTTDEDVENMMEEYDRLAVGSRSAAGRTPRLRLFLFSPGDADAGNERGFGSVHDLTTKRDSWFLDTLNGGSGRLERGRSETSSIMSEIPDYLFGLDNNFDEPRPKTRLAHESSSAPGSPVIATSSPKYCSTSSLASVPPIPDLPPVKTKPETFVTPAGPEVNRDAPLEPAVQQQAGYTMHQLWQYMQEPVPVYYMPGSNIPLRPVPLPVQYFNQAAPAVAGGQIPVGYGQSAQRVWTNPGHTGPVYVGGPLVGRPAVAGAYDYPAAAVIAADALDGGLRRNSSVNPGYPAAAGVSPVGLERR